MGVAPCFGARQQPVDGLYEHRKRGAESSDGSVSDLGGMIQHLASTGEEKHSSWHERWPSTQDDVTADAYGKTP